VSRHGLSAEKRVLSCSLETTSIIQRITTNCSDCSVTSLSEGVSVSAMMFTELGKFIGLSVASTDTLSNG
jgi:uncharacterized protein (UPF0210 family)